MWRRWLCGPAACVAAGLALIVAVGTPGVSRAARGRAASTSSADLGSLPEASATFATDGLNDTYAAKPAFGVYRGLIARYGRR